MNQSNSKLLSAILCILGIFLSSGFANAQGQLADQLGKLRSAEAADYEPIISTIVEGNPSIEDLANAIASGVSAKPSKDRADKLVAGWSEWVATDINGTERPYQVFVPNSVAEGAKPTALVVHMHGAVGKPDYGTGRGSPQATGYAGYIWPKVAQSESFIIACPVGRDDCAWWKDAGVAHVDAVIRDLRRTIDFPEDSIYAAGFSDGGSGCYYRAMTAPEPFAGFIALNGHPAVASSASKKQIYLPNLAMTATFAGMTHLDSLYPSKTVMPHVLTALQHDANILTVAYPKMNHQPSYFSEQTPAILSFIKSNKRLNRDSIRWYSADRSTGRIGPVELIDFSSVDDAEEVNGTNVMSQPGRIRLGVQFGASNNKVALVVDDSAAASAGILTGDELIKFNSSDVTSSRSLRGLLSQAKSGDSFQCLVKRDGKNVKLSGAFPPFVSKPIYRRDLPTGYVEYRFVNTEGKEPLIDLVSKNVTRMRIWLPDDLSSLSQVTVNHNGKQKNMPVKRLSKIELLMKYAQTGSSHDANISFVEITN